MKRYAPLAILACLAAACGDNIVPDWCGLETVVTPAVNPVLPTDWTDGKPFAVGDASGYAVTQYDAESAAFGILVFPDAGEPHAYWLTSYALDTETPGATFGVDDVLVEDGSVHVLYHASVFEKEYREVRHVLLLASFDHVNGTWRLSALWNISVAKEDYRLAADGDEVYLGRYDRANDALSYRRLDRQDGFLVPGDETPLGVASEADWAYGHFVSFQAQDGLLTYRLSSEQYDMVQTTRYRACP